MRVCWQLYVFGGKNEEEEFNDLKVMKLINPSERQPGILFLNDSKTRLVLVEDLKAKNELNFRPFSRQ